MENRRPEDILAGKTAQQGQMYSPLKGAPDVTIKEPEQLTPWSTSRAGSCLRGRKACAARFLHEVFEPWNGSPPMRSQASAATALPQRKMEIRSMPLFACILRSAHTALQPEGSVIYENPFRRICRLAFKGLFHESNSVYPPYLS